MQLWTPEHAKTLLPALAVMLVLAWILRFALRGKSHAVRMIPIQIIAVLLVALEIGKQVLSLKNGYDLYHLPFHFCSLFIFMMPIMAFYKGKHQQKIYAITAAISTSVMMLMLAYPDLIYSAGNIQEFFTNYFSMHTVAFHNLVLLAAILIPALSVHVPQKGEQKAVVLFMVVFCLVSASMAQLLETNFNNFYQCNVPPLEALRLQIQGALGYGVTQALYVVIVTILNLLFVLGCYWLYRAARKLWAGKE